MAPYVLKRTLSSANEKAAKCIYKYKYEQYLAQIDKVPVLNKDVIKSSMVIPLQYGIWQLLICTDEERLSYMQMERSINWCESARYLVPLITDMDGNCMLHSISTYIFGVQDKDQVFQKLLYQRLFMEKEEGPLILRWRRNTELFMKKIVHINMRYYRIESRTTWRDVLDCCSPKPVLTKSLQEQSTLTDIHIFAISNIIGRAVIVLCDHFNQIDENETVSALKVGGIYLPLLRQPKECEKSPIVIGFKNNHFVPLISLENLELPLSKKQPNDTAQHCIPLVNFELSKLPIRFLLEQEETEACRNNLLASYLETCLIPFRDRDVEAALLKFKPPPAWSIELLWSLFTLSESIAETSEPGAHLQKHTYDALIPCARKKVGCRNMASNNKEHMCIGCYEEYIAKKKAIPKRAGIRKVVVQHQANDLTMETFDGKCISFGCTNLGLSDLRNMCRECYIKQIQSSSLFGSITDQQSSPKDKSFGNVLFELDDNPGQNKAYIGSASTNVSSANENIGGYHSYHYDSQLHASSGSMASSSAGERANPRLPEFTKSKVLCGVPGCENNIKNYTTLCDYHHDHNGPREECIISGCNNTADLNDHNLCMMCFQSNKHLVKELELKGIERQGDVNRHIGRGSVPRFERPRDDDGFDLAGLAESLPPLPSTSQPDIPPFKTQFYQADMGLSRHSDVSSDPVMFHAPQLYEGFTPGGRSINFGKQDGALNWQKECVASGKNANGKQNKCNYCENHANPNKNGLCNQCYNLKMGTQKQGSSANLLRKCINDGCREPGQEKYNFLCEKCYQEQMRELQPVSQFAQPPRRHFDPPGNMSRIEAPPIPQIGRPPNHGAPTNPCITKGCVNFAFLPSRICTRCQQDPPPYSRFIGENRRTEDVATFPSATSQGFGVRQQCKALDCEYFGDAEYGGYCSSCFMDITKQESAVKRQSGIRTFAPPDVHAFSTGIQNNVGPRLDPNPLPFVQGVAAPEPCQSQGCDMYGRPEWQGYCSKCYKNRVERDVA